MAILMNALRSVDFLEHSGTEAVVRFMVLGRAEYRTKNDTLWSAETHASRFVIPITGTLKCVTRSEDGREFVRQFSEPGEWAGLAECLEVAEHPDDAIVTRKGEFFWMTNEGLRRFFAEYPACQAAAWAAVREHHRGIQQELAEVVLRPLRARLAKLLLHHACVLRGDGARVLLDVPQGDVASRLGTVREVVTRTLGRFEQKGLIRRTTSGIVIANWDGLCAVSGDDPDSEHASAGSDSADRISEHTRRYFLPQSERDHGRIQPQICRVHLDDCARCLEAGCPAALSDACCQSDARKREQTRIA